MDWLNDFMTDWGGEVLATVATIIVALIVIAIARRGVSRWTARVDRKYATSDDHTEREQAQRMTTLTGVMHLVLTLTVWTVVALTIMAIWGIPMSPLLAVGATLALAIGFGAQDFVRDVIAGFLILLEDQYAIGDVVSIAGVSGSVETITLRTTVLRDLEGAQHHVPNGEIRVASNLTAGFSRVVVDVPVSYDSDVDEVIAVLADEAGLLANDAGWSESFLEQPEVLGVNELGDSAVDIRVLLTIDTDRRWQVKREFLRRVKIRLDAEGVEIPYQIINVIDRTEPDTQSP